ncbi:MAG: 2'-5' RNA ligase family protein [Acidimicrobiia bacterium]
MPRRRFAVALLVPEPVAHEVDGLRRALGDGSPARVAPHVTLVPPVNVRAEEVTNVLAHLRAVAGATERFSVRFGPMATFYPVTPVLYLAVGGEGVDDLADLRHRVFVPPLARCLTYPFVAHATVADDCEPDRIDAALAALVGYRADVSFEAVYLLEEHAAGPYRWNPIADFPFEPVVRVGRGGLDLELSCSAMADPATAPLLGDLDDLLPAGATPIVVAARRAGEVVGALRGWCRDGEVRAVDVAADDDLARLLLSQAERRLPPGPNP